MLINYVPSFSLQGEYIASIKCLQLEVFFFRKKKSYRWGPLQRDLKSNYYYTQKRFVMLEIKSLDFNRFFLKNDNKKGAKNPFTCVTCHPKDDCIATGHEDGKIRLWWASEPDLSSPSRLFFLIFSCLFSFYRLIMFCWTFQCFEDVPFSRSGIYQNSCLSSIRQT